MEADRFDALVRAAHQAGSRRGLLGGLAVLALAPLTTLAKPQPAACLPVGKRCSQTASGAGHAKRPRKGKHKPPACRTCCSRFGAADANGKARCTCKGEGVSCDNASQCCGGQCTAAGKCTGCAGATVFCGDGCADLQTNNQHCGSCDTACTAGQRCTSGQCGCDSTSCPTGCCAGTSCQRGTSTSACGDGGATCAICLTGQRCQDGACVCTGACSAPKQLDPSTCQCQCPAATCRGGKQLNPDTCVCECPSGTPDVCGGQCTNKQTDNHNCGACGSVCSNGATCQNGACQCPNGTTLCNGACVNLQTDPQHCGSCPTTCTAPKTVCQGGVCQCPATTCTVGKEQNPNTCQCQCAGEFPIEFSNGTCATTCVPGTSLCADLGCEECIATPLGDVCTSFPGLGFCTPNPDSDSCPIGQFCSSVEGRCNAAC